MTSPNDAAPRTSSATPGALGSVEITERFGVAKARSTSTTLLSLPSVRASVIAAKVVPTLRALPTTVTRRPASPACRNRAVTWSMEVNAAGAALAGIGTTGGEATRGIIGGAAGIMGGA